MSPRHNIASTKYCLTFGYSKGAFTGADRDHMGLFEEANGGILFLDEIGDILLTVQNKLLRAIEEKQIKRLGDDSVWPIP